jgi:ribosomal protein S18 acetylase RimI-like enzyme
MAEDIPVRIARLADAEALVAFNRAMAWETERKELELETVTAGVDGLLRHPHRGFYVVAEAGGELAGSLMITFEWSDWRNATFWWIQSVYIRPEFRRKGIYRRLYDTVKQRARAEGGVCGFRLYVEKDNLGAQKVYKTLGMAESYYLMFEEGL